MNKTRIPMDQISTKMMSFIENLEDDGFVSYRIIRNCMVIKWDDRFNVFMSRMGINILFGTFSLNASISSPYPHSSSYPYSPFPSLSPVPRPLIISTEHFSQWWESYPRKANRTYACECWERNIPKFQAFDFTWEKMEQAMALYNEHWEPMLMKHIPHPSTWLNQKRWLDPPAPVFPDAPEVEPEGKQSKVVELLEQALIQVTGIQQRKHDREKLAEVANNIERAIGVIDITNPDISYHVSGTIGLTERYGAYLVKRYYGFKELTATMLGPGSKSWQKFITQLQESIGFSLIDGGLIHCVGERWITLLNGNS